MPTVGHARVARSHDNWRAEDRARSFATAGFAQDKEAEGGLSSAPGPFPEKEGVIEDGAGILRKLRMTEGQHST
jgi:hypothetical protein